VDEAGPLIDMTTTRVEVVDLQLDTVEPWSSNACRMVSRVASVPNPLPRAPEIQIRKPQDRLAEARPLSTDSPTTLPDDFSTITQTMRSSAVVQRE
jgi:hypothetical protein